MNQKRRKVKTLINNCLVKENRKSYYITDCTKYNGDVK